MTTIDLRDMGPDDARASVDRVKAHVAAGRADLIAQWRGRAWIALGYATWDALCDAEYGVRMALPRDERREAVAELRAEGMSTRAIGSALGVADQTVRADLGRVREVTQSDPTPERVVSLDGRERPATRPVAPTPTAPQPEALRPEPISAATSSDTPPRNVHAADPFDIDAAVERYPDLDAWRDRPDRIEALASTLDGYAPTERASRLEALAAAAAARREGRVVRVAEPDERPDRLFAHANGVNRAASAITPSEFADLTDPAVRDLWRDQLNQAAEALSNYAAALNGGPALRSVR